MVSLGADALVVSLGVDALVVSLGADAADTARQDGPGAAAGITAALGGVTTGHVAPVRVVNIG